MTWFANLKIGSRLAAAFAVLLALIAVVAAGGVVGTGRVYGELKSIYEDRLVPLSQIGQIQQLVTRNRVLVMEMTVNPSADDLRKRDVEIRANLEKVDSLWRDYMATYLTPEEKKLAAEFATARATYVKDGLLQVRDAALQGKADEAQRLYSGKLTPLAPPVDRLAHELIALQVSVAAAQYKDAEASASTQRITLVGVTVVSIALGAAMAWLISRSITRPIRQAVTVARAVAEGDLTSRIECTGRDEPGQLLAALKTMNDNLVGIVGNVRQGSDSIATGSAQIASGNADLSQRTEEQAANLQQTAASMEQLTSTVQHNSQAAHQAEQLATAASQAAAAGGEVVGRVVGTMNEISGSSRKIADIIGVIDGIAFQTNILALNAAVEAARAGDQGRGFAVVASEVRSLAQRSAEAARQIKALIEESVRNVEAGSQLVDDAGRSMGDIVQQVRRVTDLVTEISSASTQQTQGIGQVSEAVAQLDQVTQQNAALVEESAAAAASLNQQAERLAAAVAVFKVDRGQPVGSAA